MNGRVLVFEALATNRIVLKVRLAAAGYVVEMPLPEEDLGEAVRRTQPVAVILGAPAAAGALLPLLRALRALPRTGNLPVLVLGGALSPIESAALFRAGADAVLSRPLDSTHFLARLRSLIRADEILRSLSPEPERFAQLGLAEASTGFDRPGRIALICQRPETALTLRHQLAPLTRHQILPLLPEEALSGRAERADAYVIDAELGAAGSGTRLIAELSSRAMLKQAKFALRKAPSTAPPDCQVFDTGAEDILSPDMAPVEMAARIDRLLSRKRQADQLHEALRDGLRLAMTDALTGIDNRRAGLAQLAERLATGPDGRAVAVILVDIDRFKSVNDRFGHSAGDFVLIEVARRLRAALRPEDMLCRFGGEEFLAVLTGTSAEEARDIAQRLCDQVERYAVALPDRRAIRVTVSAGMALQDPECKADAGSLIDRADRALLRSKEQGRNRLTIAWNAA